MSFFLSMILTSAAATILSLSSGRSVFISIISSSPGFLIWKSSLYNNFPGWWLLISPWSMSNIHPHHNRLTTFIVLWKEKIEKLRINFFCDYNHLQVRSVIVGHSEVGGFWSKLCAIKLVTWGQSQAGDTKTGCEGQHEGLWARAWLWC